MNNGNMIYLPVNNVLIGLMDKPYTVITSDHIQRSQGRQNCGPKQPLI